MSPNLWSIFPRRLFMRTQIHTHNSPLTQSQTHIHTHTHTHTHTHHPTMPSRPSPGITWRRGRNFQVAMSLRHALSRSNPTGSRNSECIKDPALGPVRPQTQSNPSGIAEDGRFRNKPKPVTKGSSQPNVVNHAGRSFHMPNPWPFCVCLTAAQNFLDVESQLYCVKL